MDHLTSPPQAIHRPVASNNNEVLAVINSDALLHIIDVRTGSLDARLALPKEIRSSISDLAIFKWSPESVVFEQDRTQITRRWILLAFSTRVAVLTIDTNHHGSPVSDNATLLVDYQLETHLGKISLADFVISHENIIVMFESATHASILSTTSANRSDIPLPKYATAGGLAQSPLRNSFALLIRSRGQDNIAIVTTSDGIVGQPLVFAAGVHDAQGISWSPNGDPILAVWDTAAHGIQIVFFTALGHPLQKLKLDHSTFNPDQSMPGVGISCLIWVESETYETILGIGDGHGQIFVRKQSNRDMISSALAQFKHSSTVDGSTCIIWQEYDSHAFIQQEIAIDLKFDPDTAIEDLSFNADQTLLASKIKNHPKSLWLWQIGRPTSSPMTLLLFQHEVKQTSWHPFNPHVLIIMTNCKRPLFFTWHDVQLPPQAHDTRLTNAPPTSKWKAIWLPNLDPTQAGARVPLMISSTRAFDLGMLGRKGDHVMFESILDQNGHEEADMDTPSKPGGRVQRGSHVGLMTQSPGAATDDMW